MYDRDTVELALLALEEGMAEREAAELCGASLTSVRRWARQGPPTRPRGRAARPPRPPARMYPPDAKEGPLNEAERAVLALPQNQPNAPLYPAGGAPGSRPGALPHFGRPRYLGPPPRARSTAG